MDVLKEEDMYKKGGMEADDPPVNLKGSSWKEQNKKNWRNSKIMHCYVEFLQSFSWQVLKIEQIIYINTTKQYKILIFEV